VVIGALVTGLVLLSARQAPAKDPDIRVLCSNGIKAAMEALIPEAERAAGRTIVIQFSSSAALKRSIDGGEPFDLAILTPGIVDDLIKAGKIQAGTHTDLASAALAVGVRAGAPKADVGTPEAMKRTLLAAKSITYTKEGAASAAIASMVRSLGIQDQLASRTTLQTVPGHGAEGVAKGEHELVIAHPPQRNPAGSRRRRSGPVSQAIPGACGHDRRSCRWRQGSGRGEGPHQIHDELQGRPGDQGEWNGASVRRTIATRSRGRSTSS
jgi:molybdate transport system substrate-binding protein